MECDLVRHYWSDLVIFFFTLNNREIIRKTNQSFFFNPPPLCFMFVGAQRRVERFNLTFLGKNKGWGDDEVFSFYTSALLWEVCVTFVIFWSSIPPHTVHGVLKARMLKWFAIPFSGGPHFVRTLHHDLSVLGGLHTARLIVSLS